MLKENIYIRVYTYIYLYIKSFFGVRDLVRSFFFFFVSAEVCDSRNWNSRSNIASFERRLREAAPTPLALPCLFLTSTWTLTDAERDRRGVAKIPHVEEEFRRLWLNLNVCNAWMIYNIGIISKRYLKMFGILRWHVQLIIVSSQIVDQACTCLDDLQNWHHFQAVLDNVSANTTYYCLVTDCGVFSTLVSSRAQDSRRDEARLFAPSRPRPRAA